MDKKYYYIVTGKSGRCRGFQFKVGETYTIESKELKFCSNNLFNFCKKLEDTIDYYITSEDRHFLIEVLGDITILENKLCSNKIRIVREITKDEIEDNIGNRKSKNATNFLALYSANANILKEIQQQKHFLIRNSVAKKLAYKWVFNKYMKVAYDFGYTQYLLSCNHNANIGLLYELLKTNSEDILLNIIEHNNSDIPLLLLITKSNKVVPRFSAIRELYEKYNYNFYELYKKNNDW